MNYLTEMNRFYDWLETNQIPKSAIALWHGLMHIANKTGWEQKFTVAISTIESKTGFKKSELCIGRNILAQKGRIIWRERGGSLSAEYEIVSFCVHNTDAINYTKSYTNPDTIHNTNPTQTGTINKLNKSKLKKTKHSPGGKAPVKENDFSKSVHWKKMVDTWFVFYKEKYLIEPTFNGQSAKNLKLIADRLQKLAENANQVWTEDYAERCLLKFLNNAISDDWLKSNFLLNNLYSKFDSIIQKNGTGNNLNGKQAGRITGNDLNQAHAKYFGAK